MNFDNFFLDIFKDNKLDNIMDYIMIYITKMGDGIFFVAILLVFLAIKKTRKTSFMLLSTYGFAALVTTVVKEIFKRERPFNLYDIELIIDVPHGLYSFPSGHATNSFALLFFYFLLFKNHKNKYLKLSSYFAVILGAIIAFSRVYLNVHFMSDVIAGAILGILIAFFANFIFKKLKFL